MNSFGYLLIELYFTFIIVINLVLMRNPVWLMHFLLINIQY